MAFELKQNLKLSQQLIMTPQLQQAIKLLQLSRMELVETINQEMEENPLLEEVAADEGGDEEIVPDVEGDLQPIESADVKLLQKTEELTGEGDGREEFDWNNYLEDYGPVGVTYGRQDAEAPTWDNILCESQTLAEYLMWQMKLSPLDEDEIRVGTQIIGNLDQNGYLCATTAEIAALENVGEEFAESVLRKIQEFDPPGIAARNLQECLLIQARMMGVKRNPLVETIISEHLKDLELKNYLQIARKLKVPLREVEKAVLIISSMDPRPGSIYAEEKTQAIIPDVYVVKSGDEYKIIVNDDGLPRLRISNFYREIMAGLGTHGNNEQENGKKYIREKVQAATWLIKSIQQRQKTIYKVAESIVKYQRDFFDKGINYLKPLVLRDVAHDVEMHESTISRVVNNKYMHTPRGIFEMKYFFGSSIQRVSGETIASKSVKEEIKKIIGQENPKKPYSDCEIVDMLKEGGIDIARRTVAKYREMMGILPSSKRKKYF
ncbi:MAG TPA: RNA polymerase factor sigma-54 [Smithellaceae bacterium]|nr:RNA polymerase factor sigma-54 [Smithellaceae bacterium]HRS89641.1 RNA polymerase factor sigma-54 [Smithellaceae bacterium]HRV25803.1 RNA polymerase factor sigma-54 [Smithellaceae bacterium]